MWKVTLDGDKLVFTPFFDEEPKKVSVSTLYGETKKDNDPYIEFLESEIRRIRAGANTHYGQSIGWMDEMQDLKLENDMLQRQNELMEDYIHAIACVKSKKSKYYGLCKERNCPYFDHDKEFGQGACTLGSRDLIEQEAADIIEELEDLG